MWFAFAGLVALAVHDGVVLVMRLSRSRRAELHRVPLAAAMLVFWSILAVATLIVGGVL